MSDVSSDFVGISPKQFEAEVENIIRHAGIGLSEFKVQRLEKIEAADGTYEMDVTARFEALGARFLVLIECKHHKSSIKREVVQILYDRLRAVGGHKGMIFSTAKFQKGAIEFAQTHGIALIQMIDKDILSPVSYYWAERSSEGHPKIPTYVGCIVELNEEGEESYQQIIHLPPQALLERFTETAT